MASVPEVSIASLEALLREKEAQIKGKKEKAKVIVAKLKADHAEALRQEKAAKQQLRVCYSFLLLSYHEHSFKL